MIMHFIEDIPVTYEDIHRFLSGITFNVIHPSAKYCESLNAQNKWIEGTNIEMIRTLLYSNRFFFTDNEEPKPILIIPSFCTLMCANALDACNRLEKKNLESITKHKN